MSLAGDSTQSVRNLPAYEHYIMGSVKRCLNTATGPVPLHLRLPGRLLESVPGR